MKLQGNIYFSISCQVKHVWNLIVFNFILAIWGDKLISLHSGVVFELEVPVHAGVDQARAAVVSSGCAGDRRAQNVNLKQVQNILLQYIFLNFTVHVVSHPFILHPIHVDDIHGGWERLGIDVERSHVVNPAAHAQRAVLFSPGPVTLQLAATMKL